MGGDEVMREEGEGEETHLRNTRQSQKDEEAELTEKK